MTTILIIDDERDVREGVSYLLQGGDRHVITAPDPNGGIVAAAHYRPSVVLLDIKYSGPFGFEGLSLIEELRAMLPESRIVAMSGDPSAQLEAEALRVGATAFIAKPFGTAEIAPFVPYDDGGDGEITHLPSIDEIIDQRRLVMHFQPIVSLDGSGPIGWEALARGEATEPFASPYGLFEYARRHRRSFELNRACIVTAIESGAALAAKGRIFINVDPEVLTRGGELVQTIIATAERARVPLQSLVLEITERRPLPGEVALAAIRDLREAGASIAIDDLGVAYAHFPHLRNIAPAFMKVAQELGGVLGQDAASNALVRHFLEIARVFDCQLIVEGIEGPAGADEARALGVPLAQGFLFGRPQRAADAIIGPTTA